VKAGIAGNGFAKKPQMQKALQMILKLSEIPKPDDAADALAIAYLTSLKVR
jgi:crossover junction endodeoxyribonuclease RuvC